MLQEHCWACCPLTHGLSLATETRGTIGWGISNTLLATEGGDRREAALCACWARVAQLGSEAEDMPRALHGACMGVSLGGTLVGCNGEHAQVLHVGISSAFDLTSLGVSLLFIKPQFDTLGLSGFSPSHACFLTGTCCEVCRAMGRVWVAHGRLSVVCCTPNGGWSIAYSLHSVSIGLSHLSSPLLQPPAVKRWGWDGGMCPTASGLPSPSSHLLITSHWMWVRCGVFWGALCDLGCSSC